jgi:two-component sensor histidine kinase
MAEELELELPAVPESVAQARGAIGDVLAGVDARSRDAVRLIVSELVTNAVKHGPDAPISLLLRRQGATVYGEVSDRGAGPIAAVSASAHGGFGLHVVETMSDRWGIEEGATRVWFEVAAGR